MSTSTASRSDEIALFLGNENAAFHGKLMVAGGTVLFFGGILMGAVLILLPPDFSPGPEALTWVTTPPILAALVLISIGLSQWRAPQQVDVGPQGVTIHSGFRDRHIDWSDVAEIQTGERSTALGNTTLKTVKLLGPNRKLLVELNSHLQPFDDLVVKLWEHASVGRELEVTDTAHKKKRLEAWFLVILGPLFAALGVWVANESWHEVQQKQAFQKHADIATATIVKHYKFNVTPRIEYVFRDADGDEFRRGTIVASDVWSRLKEGGTVAVRYLPEDPDYSRLAVGDLDDKQSHDPQLMVAVGPFVGLLGLFFFVAGVLQFCGFDLDAMLGLKKKKSNA